MEIPSKRRAYGPALAAAVVAVVVLAGAAVAPSGRVDFDPLGYFLLLAGPLSLAGMRRFPVAVLFFTTVCVLIYFLRGYPGVVAALPLMVSLLVAVRVGHHRIALVPISTLMVVMAHDLLVVENRPAQEIIEDRFLLAGWLVASAMMGEAIRQWSLHVKEMEERAADAERTREEVAARRAGEERLRIARDLHDSLTHSISIIKVQTGVAIHLARKRGEQVPDALLAVQEASAEAMRELRSTLGVLRGDGDKPAIGLGRLDELVERARSAGQETTVTITGERRSLPSDVDMAAYRIVQEALTNIARHAGPAAVARVHVGYADEALTVRVDDDGLATTEAPPTPGVGLSGMRERVTAIGGRLEAAPRPEGGFTVRAELPIPAPAARRPDELERIGAVRSEPPRDESS